MRACVRRYCHRVAREYTSTPRRAGASAALEAGKPGCPLVLYSASRKQISLATAGCRWSCLLFRLQIDIDDEEEDQDNVPVRAAQRATYNRDAQDNVPGARGVHRETLAPS